MDNQKSLQKPKLGNSEVTRHHSLQEITKYCEIHRKTKKLTPASMFHNGYLASHSDI